MEAGASPGRLEHLDALRALAAFIVFFDHVRRFLFPAYGDIDQLDLAASLFYAGTSWGHQAVIVFFALSGYLVGGAALNQLLAHRWSWSRYLLRRMTRLWIVIIPALVVTFVLDRLALLFTGGDYLSPYASLAVGPIVVQLDHSFSTFGGNALFLQSIATPVFGSNFPMWSLANEFVYYLLGPVLAAGFLMKSALKRLLYAGVFILGVAAVPAPILLLGLIWLAGAAAAGLQHRFDLSSSTGRAVAIGSAVAAGAGILAVKIYPGLLTDLVLGFAVAALLPALAALPSFGPRYRRLAKYGSELSFSLYVFHTPFATFIVAVFIGPRSATPDLQGCLYYVVIWIMTLFWAVLCWFMFERNTNRVFAALSFWLEHRGAAGTGTRQRA